jgi:DNA-binding LacI/PurR family transcriptional regulator
MKKPTLKDVAREANISTAMASRVLGGYGYFSEDTKTRVLDAAERLNYRPNAIARALKNKSTKAIGVLISNIVSVFWPTIVRAIEDAASKSGDHLILCNTDENPSKEMDYLTTLYERDIDGLIVSPTPNVHSYLKKLSRGGMPLVLVDRKVKGLSVPTITIDNTSGSYEAVTHLISKGHTRIGVITGLKGIMTSEDRLEGYRRALQHHDIPIESSLMKSGDFSKEKAYSAVQEFLDMEEPPTALFVCNETMALGALIALKDRNIRVPEQMSVIGFGNPDWAPIASPPLSTVRQPTYAIGTLACEKLLAEITNPEQAKVQAETICMKPELVLRGSC